MSCVFSSTLHRDGGGGLGNASLLPQAAMGGRSVSLSPSRLGPRAKRSYRRPLCFFFFLWVSPRPKVAAVNSPANSPRRLAGREPFKSRWKMLRVMFLLACSLLVVCSCLAERELPALTQEQLPYFLSKLDGRLSHWSDGCLKGGFAALALSVSLSHSLTHSFPSCY